jgi:hypothetical protein
VTFNEHLSGVEKIIVFQAQASMYNLALVSQWGCWVHPCLKIYGIFLNLANSSWI